MTSSGSLEPIFLWSSLTRAQPYSSKCVEGEFSEVGLPLYGVLGSLHRLGLTHVGALRHTC